MQRELFLSEVNNKETIAVIKGNNETYCLQKRIENVPAVTLFCEFDRMS